MAQTPQGEAGPTKGERREREEELDREVERRAEHVMEEESDPLKPAAEERDREGGRAAH